MGADGDAEMKTQFSADEECEGVVCVCVCMFALACSGLVLVPVGAVVVLFY